MVLFSQSVISVSADKSCKLTDLETGRVVTKIPFDTVPLKVDVHLSKQFVITTDEFGCIYFHDFREKLGIKKLVDSSHCPVSCFIKSDFDLVFFDFERNTRLIDFRTNQIVVNKQLPNVVNCGISTKDSRFLIIADTDIKLLNKLSLDVKLLHKIDKGNIQAIARNANEIFSGGFDCEIKVFL